MKTETKKALSASTPKAPILTLIPTANRNIAMNNNTAVQLNNQFITDLPSMVKHQSEFMQKAGRSINAISHVLQRSLLNYCDGEGEVLPNNEVSSLLEAIDLISSDVGVQAEQLEKSLVNGGF